MSERQKIFASIIFIVFMFVAVASGLMASFWQNEGEVLGVSEKIYQKYE